MGVRRVVVPLNSSGLPIPILINTMKRTRFFAIVFIVVSLSARMVSGQTWENRNALKLVLPSSATNPTKTLTIQAPTITGSSFTWTLPDGNASGILTNGGTGTLSWTQSLSGLSIDNTPIGATTANTGRFTSITTTTGGADFNSHGITNTGSITGATTITLSGAISGGTSFSGSGDITSTQGKLITGSNSNAGHVKIGNGAASNFFADLIIGSGGLSADRTYTIPTSQDANATFAITTATPTTNVLMKWNGTAGNTTNSSITDDATTVSTSEGISSTGTAGFTTGATSNAGKLVIQSGDGTASHATTLTSGAAAARAVAFPDAAGRISLTTSAGTALFTGPTSAHTFTLPDADATLVTTTTINNNTLPASLTSINVNSGGITNAGSIGGATTVAASTSVTSPILYGGSAGNDALSLRSTSSGSHSTDLISFYTNATETMRLTSGGNLLIGNTNGTNMLSVGSSSQFSVSSAGAITGTSLTLGSGSLSTVGDVTFDGTSATRTVTMNSPTSTGAGNTLKIQGAAANTTGTGGALQVVAGAGTGTTQNGGALTLASGAKTSGGTDGDIILKTGGTGGTTQMTVNNGGGVTVNNGNFNITSGSYKIGSTDVLTSSSLGSGVTGSFLTSVGTITTGTWTGTTIALANGGTGATTQAAALKNLVPDTASQTGEYLQVTAGGGITWNRAPAIITGATTANLGTNTTAEFFFPNGRSATQASAAAGISEMLSPFAGTVRNLYVILSATPGGTNRTRVFTLVKNESTTTGLTCTVATAATSSSDVANSFTIAAGDRISIKEQVVGGSGAPNAAQASWGFEIDP